MAWVEKHFLIAENQKIFYCFFECCNNNNNNNSNKNTTKRPSLEPAYNWLAHLKLFKLLGRFEKNVKSFSVHSTVKPLRCKNFFVVLAMDNAMSLSSKWMDSVVYHLPLRKQYCSMNLGTETPRIKRGVAGLRSTNATSVLCQLPPIPNFILNLRQE